MKKFLASTSGNFATMFAIASVPLIGAAGMAIDYSRALNVQSFIQAETDQASLEGARLGTAGDASGALDYVRSMTQQRYGNAQWIADMNVRGEWVSATDFRVTSTGAVPVTLLGAVPGFPEAVDLTVFATARLVEPRLVYHEPEFAHLDPEAHDYNRVYVYCYDEATDTRSEETPIADNVGNAYAFTMPVCGEGQPLSYRLFNVRNGRISPSLVDNPSSERYNYYSDTVLVDGVEKYSFSGWDIFETVMCDTVEQCTGVSKGGIIPEGKNRNPQQTTQRCQPGKYIYYGWEDRPPGMGGAGSDRDYDDIRIVMKCPSVEEVGDRLVRLVE